MSDITDALAVIIRCTLAPYYATYCYFTQKNTKISVLPPYFEIATASQRHEQSRAQASGDIA
jgi:hypothetical protein